MSLRYFWIYFLYLLGQRSTIVVCSDSQFLFSGQSNMIGHSSGRYSIEKGDRLQDDILKLLGNGMEGKISLRLQEAFKFARIREDNNTVADHEAKLVTELYNRGILDNLSLPNEYASCHFDDPSHTSCRGQQNPVPISPDINCGCSFGHELVFSHTLSQTLLQSKTFTIRKIAVGGTEIYKDWFPGIGKHWNSLNSTIHNNPGDWRAFVWHQGENDCFSFRDRREDTTQFYLGNLTQFIAAVRSEIVSVNPTRFTTPSDVPVAIFELGFWPHTEYRDHVVQAQRTFVANDPNSVLIKLDDLGQFYHLEVASLMIGGFRLARGMAQLLGPLYNNTILNPLEVPHGKKNTKSKMSQEKATEAILSSSKLSQENDKGQRRRLQNDL